jgi:malonyl-CoA O-methyltransferase
MTAAPPEAFRVDPRALRRAAERAARLGPRDDPLVREIERRMLERLDLFRATPRRVLDAGSALGPRVAGLRARYPDAEIVALDGVWARARRAAAGSGSLAARARRWLGAGAREHHVCADFAALPFAPASFDMVWSNLGLNAAPDLARALADWQRVLTTGGLVLFTCFGPDTLRELREASGAAMPGHRVHAFVDMHDIGDMLVAAGAADPVMDVERLTLTYERFDALVRDLRAAGATNALAARPRGLATPRAWARRVAAYEDRRTDARLPVTIELIYGHAWKAPPRVAADGRAIIKFAPESRRAKRT